MKIPWRFSIRKKKSCLLLILSQCQPFNLFKKQIIPKSVKDTVSTHLKVARGIWKACTQNHGKSLGYFLIALSCPASDILNASSGLFSIFKLPQQRGIVFPINIAFWLFTHGQIIPYPEEGAADSYIAPKSMQWQDCVTLVSDSSLSPVGGTSPLSGICFTSNFMLAQLCLQTSWGNKRVQAKPPRWQESSTVCSCVGHSPALQ